MKIYSFSLILLACILNPAQSFAASEIIRRGSESVQNTPAPVLPAVKEQAQEPLEIEQPAALEAQLETKHQMFTTSTVTWAVDGDEETPSKEEWSESPFVEWGTTSDTNADSKYKAFMAKGRYSRARSLSYSSYQGVGTTTTYGRRSKKRVYYTKRASSRGSSNGFASISNNSNRYRSNAYRSGISGNFNSSSFATLGRQRSR